MGRDLRRDPGALGVDAKPGDALAIWSTPASSTLSTLHPEQQITPSSPRAPPLLQTVPPVPGEEIANKSILWDLPGWRKDLPVLMDPWGSFWAQPVSFPNVLGRLTKPFFLMGRCQGMEEEEESHAPAGLFSLPDATGEQAGAGLISPELSKREAEPARLIFPPGPQRKAFPWGLRRLTSQVLLLSTGGD